VLYNTTAFLKSQHFFNKKITFFATFL